MNGEKFARVLAGLAVLAVAVVAGIVSFTHIEVLALTHGYSIGTARLLPVSVDGLILASSMALLTGASPGLARVGLILGIVATLAANIAAGAHFGIVGAVVSAWPAVAFIVASEILLRMIRATRDLPSAGEAAGTVATVIPTAPATVPETVTDAVPGETAENAPSVPDSGPVDVPAHDPVAVPQVGPVAPTRARGHARPRSPRQPVPERVFAAEIERGDLPSLRTIKARMHVGTDRARMVRDQLAEILRGVPEAA